MSDTVEIVTEELLLSKESLLDFLRENLEVELIEEQRDMFESSFCVRIKIEEEIISESNRVFFVKDQQ